MVAKGLITSIVVFVAVFLVCCFTSTGALSAFEQSLRDLLKPFTVPSGSAADSALSFASKAIAFTFIFLALALAVSIFLLCLEAIASRG